VSSIFRNRILPLKNAGKHGENGPKRYVRLVLCLAFFGPTMALLGAFSTLDSGSPLWLGTTVGGLVGVFFGLVFGWNRKWRAWDYIFGPEDPHQPADDGG
jgi:hypothetical protein